MFVLNWTVLTLCLITLVSAYSNATLEDDGNNLLNEKSDVEKYYEFAASTQITFKKFIKNVLQKITPSMGWLNEGEEISQYCIRALLKYSSGLTKAKLWAVKMLDATSHLPSGIVDGTFSDYGSFDECLNIEVPGRNSTNSEFRGSSCAVKAKITTPPMNHWFIIGTTKTLNDSDTLEKAIQDSAESMTYINFRLFACVPSKCSLRDMQLIAQKVSNKTGYTIKIPMCYVKENIPLEPVHYVVITVLVILLIMVVLGTIADSDYAERNFNIQESVKKFLVAFSFPKNLSRLMSSTSGGSAEMKCLDGIKAIGICWVILIHTYVLFEYDFLKGLNAIRKWCSEFQFQLLQNANLAVEAFFIISGILVTYGCMQAMAKSNGRLNIPLLIFRRYLRLMPSLLLVMGLVFFLPLISSGPFWYEYVDPQLDSCRNYWWSSLLYFSNWMGIKKGCLLHSWYLAADFQFHIFSLIMMIFLFRFIKIGLSLLVVFILISCASIGIKIVAYDLPATLLLSITDQK